VSREKFSECLLSPFTYSVELFLKLGTALSLDLWNISHIIYWCSFLFKNCFGLQMKLHASIPNMISPWYSTLESY